MKRNIFSLYHLEGSGRIVVKTQRPHFFLKEGSINQLEFICGRFWAGLFLDVPKPFGRLRMNSTSYGSSRKGQRCQKDVETNQDNQREIYSFIETT